LDVRGLKNTGIVCRKCQRSLVQTGDFVSTELPDKVTQLEDNVLSGARFLLALAIGFCFP
jgi:hypothetical protein